MILPKSFSEEHIRELQKSSRRDPILLERTVYAFGLLEALARVGLPFVFKGGTCLMLLMDKPRRLSTDIDIIVKPGTDLDDYLNRASQIFPFVSVEEQLRVGKNNIVKKHFKFTYNSPVNNKPLYILLDVLFEDNHYNELIQKEIQNELLVTESEYLKVTLPSANCILADKLTAFAPHTIGILLNTNKDMEVMKQFYDVTSLIDIFTDYNHIVPTYELISKAEIEYRGIDKTAKDCLWDTYNAALCIASRGKINSDEYPIYVKAIRELRSHIYAENYTPEIAAVNAPKIMYMALCLLTGTTFERVTDVSDYTKQSITNSSLGALNYLKKVNLEAYAYTIKTDKLLMLLNDK